MDSSSDEKEGDIKGDKVGNSIPYSLFPVYLKTSAAGKKKTRLIK